MGIKYCKSCKKPMRPTDTHCKSCGKEYKNSPVIIVIIAAVIIAIGIAAYFLISNKDSGAVATQETPVKQEQSPWKHLSDSDPVSGATTYAAITQFVNYDTRQPVEGNFTLACNGQRDTDLIIAITSSVPVSTEGFDSIGPTGRYTVKVDDNPPVHGVTSIATHNTVFVLTQAQSAEITSQLPEAKKILVQVSNVSDQLVDYEADLTGASKTMAKLRGDCFPTPKSGV